MLISRTRWFAFAALTAAVFVPLFVFLHTGARGDALCEREVFVRGGEFSAWPPGTSCEFGEPTQTSVVVQAPLMVALLLVVLALVVVWWNRPVRET